MAEKSFVKLDVDQIECHIKWFNEINSKLSGQWLSALLNKKLNNDLRSKVNDDDCDEDVHEDESVEVENHQRRLLQLSWRFTLMLRNFFEKNFAEAFQISKELMNKEETRSHAQPPVHYSTLCFVVMGNQVNILKEWRPSVDCSVDDNEVVEIVTRIESLKGIVESDEAKAFMNALKSNLSRDMQDSQLRLHFAKKATELNPKCACWHVTLYLALRYCRRLSDFRKPPSQAEIDACEKAYALGSDGYADTVGNTIQMAKLYAELLLTCRRGSEEHQRITEQAISLARDAVRLKPESKIMKMRLVSLLTEYKTFRRYPTEGYDEAQQLVKECEVGKCSSELCHKLARFYSNQQLAVYSTSKALEWFERGLEAHIGNFSCFADMLKNVDFRLKPTLEIIQKIDTILSSQSNRPFKCKMMFIKGFFLWTVNDPEASLNLWLMAMEEAAELKINFAGLPIQNVCYISDRNPDQALRMLDNVESFMNRREQAHSNDPRFAKLKDIFSSVMEYFERNRGRVPACLAQGSSNAGGYEQQRNRGYHLNWNN